MNEHVFTYLLCLWISQLGLKLFLVISKNMNLLVGVRGEKTNKKPSIAMIIDRLDVIRKLRCGCSSLFWLNISLDATANVWYNLLWEITWNFIIKEENCSFLKSWTDINRNLRVCGRVFSRTVKYDQKIVMVAEWESVWSLHYLFIYLL
jgi:hypothetical protein